MAAKTAKLSPAKSEPKLVVFVVYPDIVLLDLVGPLQVFSHALNSATKRNGYECIVVSVDGGLIETNTVVSIPSQPISNLANRSVHTLVVVGGDGAIPSMREAKLVSGVKALAERAQRISSVCSGALVLAATGLLNGKRAVTHWDDCKMLADEFPEVHVELDPIFIQDGRVWTSAGITAGIDMALAIVSEDLGRTSALSVARSMVAQMVRSGGQSQYSPALGRQVSDGMGRFEELHEWILDNLAAELSVEVLASKAGMSSRNFSRVYSEVMGTTPAKAVAAMRIESAQDLLESTSKSLKQIARLCGFGSQDRMRRAFQRGIKTTPLEYRRSFQSAASL